VTPTGIDGWILACLAVMAVALVAMAVGQLVLAVNAARIARQATDAIQEFRRELRPVTEKVRKIAEDASKATSLTLVQAERVDQILETTARRVDETLALVQETVTRPLRNGTALVAGIRAAVEVFRAAGDRRRRRVREEEDALFIG
jgi:hypothetical protein